jgi:NADH-quinone oxidoreductase subunit N
MKEFVLILPEAILAMTVAFVVFGELTHHGERARLISATALVGLAGAFAQTVLAYQYGATQVFGHALSIDGLSLFFKLLFITLAGLAVVTSLHTREIEPAHRPEFCALVVASTLGMCLAASSADLMLAFLSLQLVNLLAFFLAGYGKRSVLSTEAAVKYLVFCVVAAALFLYGTAALFAATRSLNIYEIHRALVEHPLERTRTLVVFMLMFLGLAFQLAAFPMYLWAPDVIEGAPTPAAAFLSFGSRAAGFAVALRLLIVVFAQPLVGETTAGQWQVLGSLDWPVIVSVVSGVTMPLGSLLAYRQTGAKRMIGCLVVAESGFLLLGLLVLDQVGVAALLYNLVIELFALMGTFYVVSFLVDELSSDRLVDLRGMLARAVPECVCLVLFLLCLVGIPPMPGFIGKFTLIGAAIRHRWLVLAFVAIVSTALSTVAVARLAYHLVGDFRRPTGAPVPASLERQAYLVLLMVPMVMVGVFAEPVLDWAGKSLGFILW